MADRSTPSGRRVRLAPGASPAEPRPDRKPSSGNESRSPRPEVLDSRRSRRLAASDQTAPRGAAHTAAPTTIKLDGEPRTRAEAKARRAAEAGDLPLLTAPVAPDRSPSAATQAPSTQPTTQPIPIVRISSARDEVITTVLPTRASIKAAGNGEPGLVPVHDDVVRGRRAARPQGVRRRAELQAGRLVSNRRVWGGALALVLIAMVPGASMLNPRAAAGYQSILAG